MKDSNDMKGRKDGKETVDRAMEQPAAHRAVLRGRNSTQRREDGGSTAGKAQDEIEFHHAAMTPPGKGFSRE